MKYQSDNFCNDKYILTIIWIFVKTRSEKKIEFQMK